MLEAVLFDLDGTLADTAPDLGGAANFLLQEEGRPQQALDLLRPYTSQGARGLLRAGFGIEPDARSTNAWPCVSWKFTPSGYAQKTVFLMAFQACSTRWKISA